MIVIIFYLIINLFIFFFSKFLLKNANKFPTSLFCSNIIHHFYFPDKDIGMCGCKNGLSNYPSCVTHKPNNNTKICDEDCAQYVSKYHNSCIKFRYI